MKLSTLTGVHVLRVFHRALGAARRPAAGGLACRALATEELLALCADAELELREPMVREAAGRGDVCVGAFAGAALAGYAWFSRERAPHRNGVWVAVPARAVYRYKVLVRRALRRRGVASFLYGAADDLLAWAGKDELITCVEAHNHASIAASLKSGDRPLGWLAYWQAGRAFAAFHSSAVRGCGPRFQLRRKARPAPAPVGRADQPRFHGEAQRPR